MKAGDRLQAKAGSSRKGRFGVPRMLAALTAAAVFLSPAACRSADSPVSAATIAHIKAHLPSLDVSAAGRFPPQLAALFRYYGLEGGTASHRFGTFESGPYRLAAHVYLPAAAAGSVFVLHGYFDHSGIMQRLIRRCIQEGFAVAIFDLPGHGLSSGEPGAIDDFSQYARNLADFVRICEPTLPRPYHLVGHSTGAAVAIETLLNPATPASGFDRVVLAAPLVHHRYHRLARAQLFFIKPFVNDLPRGRHRNSSDLAFVEWSKTDPLQGRRVSLSWLEALYAWNDRLERCGEIVKAVMILQGTKDAVVDWRYNIATLQAKFSATQLVWIEGGRHQLFNESDPILAEVLQSVCTYLQQASPPAAK